MGENLSNLKEKKVKIITQENGQEYKESVY
jgi:hypothetical protein